MDTHSSYEPGSVCAQNSKLVVILLEVSEKDVGIVTLPLLIGPFKNPLWVGAGIEEERKCFI